MKVLVFGVSGMLGHTVYRTLGAIDNVEVYGTTRSAASLAGRFDGRLAQNLRVHVEAENQDSVVDVIAQIQPDVVINCIGVVKQLAEAKDPVKSITINALFPHRLAMFCRAARARLIHISTDCVFDGSQGNYTETSRATATDLYGLSKYLGEVYEACCLTLRTSIIGHELNGAAGLLEWFLGQTGSVSGHKRAYFSGVTTDELARVIALYVLNNDRLSGLFHVAGPRISKYELLKIIANQYSRTITIEPSEQVQIDRSLDAGKFRQATGYEAPDWRTMVKETFDSFARTDGGGCYDRR